MPEIRPLAIEGAAPRTTTKKIAPSDSLKSNSASGNQATDGIVWSPVMNDPNADRSTRLRATTLPTATPKSRASA